MLSYERLPIRDAFPCSLATYQLGLNSAGILGSSVLLFISIDLAVNIENIESKLVNEIS